jgi:hypothetical protein
VATGTETDRRRPFTSPGSGYAGKRQRFGLFFLKLARFSLEILPFSWYNTGMALRQYAASVTFGLIASFVLVLPYTTRYAGWEKRKSNSTCVFPRTGERHGIGLQPFCAGVP